MRIRLSLKAKVLLTFTLILAVPLWSEFSAARKSFHIKDQTEELSTKLFPILETTNVIAIKLNDIKDVYQAACMDADEDALKEAHEIAGQLSESFEYAMNLSPDDMELANLAEQSRDYCTKASRIAKSIIGGADIGELMEDLSNISVVATSLYEDIKSYREQTSEVFAANAAFISEQCQDLGMFAAGAAVTGLLISVVLAVVVAMGVRRLVNSLKSVTTGLTEGSQHLSTASDQVSSASRSLAQGSSEQAASLEEASSSLEEMSSMTRQNADNAQQANVLSEEARKAADSGSEAMARMNDAIARIQKSSEETAKIIKVIDEIAFQTNLLALNAAVEAARAGEAGKGFAVVAQEVRNLAMRSAEAAKNTTEMIEESTKNSKNGVDIAGEVGNVLGQIVEGIGKTTDLIGEIAAASQEQAQGIDQVNTAVNQMDKITQQNAANAEESASASEELKAQANQMTQIVVQLAALVGGKSDNARSSTLKPGAPNTSKPSISDQAFHQIATNDASSRRKAVQVREADGLKQFNA